MELRQRIELHRQLEMKCQQLEQDYKSKQSQIADQRMKQYQQIINEQELKISEQADLILRLQETLDRINGEYHLLCEQNSRQQVIVRETEK